MAGANAALWTAIRVASLSEALTLARILDQDIYGQVCVIKMH
jgi:hypothetical protein